MNTDELKRAVAKAANVPRWRVSMILDAALNIATEALIHGDTLKLRGYASISIKPTPRRSYYHIQTGEVCETVGVKAEIRPAERVRAAILTAVEAQSTSSPTDSSDRLKGDVPA